MLSFSISSYLIQNKTFLKVILKSTARRTLFPACSKGENNNYELTFFSRWKLLCRRLIEVHWLTARWAQAILHLNPIPNVNIQLLSEAMCSVFSQPVGIGFRGLEELSPTQHITMFGKEYPLPWEILFSLF